MVQNNCLLSLLFVGLGLGLNLQRGGFLDLSQACLCTWGQLWVSSVVLLLGVCWLLPLMIGVTRYVSSSSRTAQAICMTDVQSFKSKSRRRWKAFWGKCSRPVQRGSAIVHLSKYVIMAAQIQLMEEKSPRIQGWHCKACIQESEFRQRKIVWSLLESTAKPSVSSEPWSRQVLLLLKHHHIKAILSRKFKCTCRANILICIFKKPFLWGRTDCLPSNSHLLSCLPHKINYVPCCMHLCSAIYLTSQ